MDKKLYELLNEQVALEMEAAYIYLDMSHWLADNGFSGMSQWYRAQYEEEMEHADRYMNYIGTRDERVKLRTINVKPVSYKSPLEIAEKALAHEKVVTKLISEIQIAARNASDFATESFNNFFLDEQVEEEDSFNALIDKIKLAGEHNLYLIDQEMKLRVNTPSE